MNLREVAEHFGLHSNTFHSIKNSNPEKFNYMFGFCENKIKSYQTYLDKQVAVKQQLTHIYYELQDKKKITDFSRFLKTKGLFGSDLSFLNAVSGIVFVEDQTFQKHESFIKYEKIINLYDEYKK